jgi:hypothetical protein
MPSQTINGIIRMHNNMVSDKDILEALVAEFNKVNENAVPRVGTNFKIPVIINE